MARRGRPKGAGHDCGVSDIDLFNYSKSIIDSHVEIAASALDRWYSAPLIVTVGFAAARVPLFRLTKCHKRQRSDVCGVSDRHRWLDALQRRCFKRPAAKCAAEVVIPSLRMKRMSVESSTTRSTSAGT